MNLKKYLLYAVLFVAVYNLLDFLLSTFMFKSGYHFNISVDLIIPLVLSAMYLHTREKADALYEEMKSADQADQDKEKTES